MLASIAPCALRHGSILLTVPLVMFVGGAIYGATVCSPKNRVADMEYFQGCIQSSLRIGVWNGSISAVVDIILFILSAAGHRQDALASTREVRIDDGFPCRVLVRLITSSPPFGANYPLDQADLTGCPIYRYCRQLRHIVLQGRFPGRARLIGS